MGIVLLLSLTLVASDMSPYANHIAILQQTEGQHLAILKRQALLQLAETDTLDSLRIIHHFHYEWVRNPDSMKGLSNFDAKNLRYFAKSLLQMKKSSERLASSPIPDRRN